MEDDGFDFLTWFEETVKEADFVVLKMNAGDMELNLLSELLKSGAICSIDEMFLRCSESGDGAGKGRRCMNLYKELRGSGVFVHQL